MKQVIREEREEARRKDNRRESARKRQFGHGFACFALASRSFADKYPSPAFAFSLCSLCLCGVISLSPPVHAQTGKQAAPTYKDVQPILKARCVVCHSSEMLTTSAVSGGLALDTYAAFKKGVVGDKGAHGIYTAGKSGDSELIRRLITSSPTKLMPKGGPPLPPAQIALFKKWIDAGAPGPAMEEAKPTNAASSVLPMPVVIGTQDVTLRTRITVPPDALNKPGKTDKADGATKPDKNAGTAGKADANGKTAPPDTALTFAMKIGPLPPQTAVAFSPDGKRLAVGGYRAVIVWDTTTGQPVGCVSSLAGQVQSLAFRPDGAQLAIGGGTAGVSGEVKIVDSKTLVQVGPTLGGHTDVVFCVAWNAAGTQIATASQDKTARVWDWPTGKEKLALKDHSDAVTKVCFAPDGKALYTASLDHNARRFDLADGKVTRTFTGHADGITALAVSPNGNDLLTSGPEPEIHWWNANTGDTTRKQGAHGGPVNDIAWSKDGKLIATSGADHTVRLWDASNANHLRALEGANDWIYAAAISPDSKLVAGAGADGVVRLWEAQTGRLRLSLLAWPPSSKSTAIEYAAITPEGYFDASPGWAARLRPEMARPQTPLPALAGFVRGLRQPESVAKSWQSAPLEPAKIEPPKPTPAPATPAVSPAKSTPATAATKSASAGSAPPKTDAKTPAKGK